jgi:lipopolysaccharide transport system ATP-binding protein
MSNDIAICIENLGKRYRYGGAAPLSANFRADVTDWIKGVIRRRPDSSSAPPPAPSHHETLYEVRERHRAESPEYFWALKGLNFEIKQGEVVGIIGRNGAGKSTLLKILSRITPPTTGRVTYHGRIASLLEVGTGFHRELTGRENIYLNGSILGMQRSVIAKNFDEIVAFAEVEKFIDTPVKFYSSGMYVRLAFAVASQLNSEVLVIDEVLAVGDASFQKKCLGKMGEVAQQGRTILFVSHNMIAVNSLCGRTILLDQGRLLEDGRTDEVVSIYLRKGAISATERGWGDMRTAPGNEVVRLKKICIAPIDGDIGMPLTMQSPFNLEIEYWNLKPRAKLHITLHFVNDQGLVIFTGGSSSQPGWRLRSLEAGLYRSICQIPGNLLNSGCYFVNLLVIEEGPKIVYHCDNILTFEVVDASQRLTGWMGREPGVVRPRLEWKNEQVVSRMQ